MKKFIVIIVGLLFISLGNPATAQKQYKMGYKVQTALTSATTISVTPLNSLTLFTLGADTNVTFNAVTTYAVPSDLVIFRVKGNTRQRILAWGTNMDGNNDTIATNKTWTFSFVWDGTAYKKMCKSITD
jgi:hypothetical protein